MDQHEAEKRAAREGELFRLLAENVKDVQLKITYALAEALTVDEAAPKILEAIGEGLGWDVGGFWLVDHHAQVLRCLEVWQQPDVALDAFERKSRERPFTMGSCLPGRVWSSGRPLWLSDVNLDGNFPRLKYAAEAGLHGAFAVPILLGPRVLGVIEFFSRSVRAADTDLTKPPSVDQMKWVIAHPKLKE